MKRSGRPKPMSDKRRRKLAAAKSDLAEFRDTFPKCWRCGEYGTEFNPVDRHHIAGRTGELSERRENWAILCRFKCHEWVHAASAERFYAVLALKYLHDPLYYDLNLIRRLRVPAVDEAKVREWVRRLEDERCEGK